ncbi:Zn(II)2Cys6 transcription factor domain-containing protein [Aspergillus foveolatus]|uniref:Zn(II)2Cys6 transcription factor domain-containing protein n=1 Tax=Aspergillus foveolatus TaxID=210207 RepID=UPI003CCD44EF
MDQPREGDFFPDKLPKSVKIRQTCNACQQAKIRCDHERPSCKRCQKHNIDCIYSISRRLGRPAKKRDPHLDSTGQNDGPLSKKARGPKKKKVKEEPMADFNANDLSLDSDDKPLFDTPTFEQSQIDDMSVESASLQTPTLMEIVTAAPFSNNLDTVSDSWFHEFMSITDPNQSCGFIDPFENDGKVDSRTPMDLDSVPVPSEGFSDSTSEGLDPPSSSSYYPGVNHSLTNGDQLSSGALGLLQGSPTYPDHTKQDVYSWSQPLPPLGGDFAEPSGFFPQVNTKRPQDYGFPEKDFKASFNSFPSIFPCQNHEQAVWDLARINAYAIQSGPSIAIDSILTRQRVLQQLIDTILQCRGCSRITVNFLISVILGIDGLITALDSITSAENDVVERLFPEYFGPLAQEYRADSGLAAQSRRFKGESAHLRSQLDACPLIIGRFCVPSEEKFAFVKRVLKRRLEGLHRTVRQILAYTHEFLAPSRGKVLLMKETYQRLRLIMAYLNACSGAEHMNQGPTMPTYPNINTAEIGNTCPSIDRIIYHLILASMESEATCQCSISALQIMNELRSVPTVVEFETILGLVDRIHSQGQAMLKCKECRANPGSTLMMLPALTDQSLALFEAACLEYNVTRKDALFDSSLPQFLCIRSKMKLGQMDLDDDETVVLVRLLLGKNSMKLLELLKGLQSLTKDGQSHRAGVATLRACESSVEPSIRRLAAFMEQIEPEPARRRRCVQDGRPGSAWPGPLKVTGPLTPTNYLADKGLFNLASSHLIGPVKVERLVESYDGIHISMDPMTQGSCSANIRCPPHVRNIPPACEGKTASAIPVLLNIVGESFGSGGWDAEEKTLWHLADFAVIQTGVVCEILLSAKMIKLTRKNMTVLMARNISSENERTTVGVENGLRGKADKNRRNRA